jgi:hypothetical protein
VKARALLVNVGLIAMAATQLWCASDDTPAPSVAPDAGAEAGEARDAEGEDVEAGSSRCSEAFCRESFPEVEGVALNALLARSPNDVWAVGSTGFAARFDGTSWRRIATGTRAAIVGVAATDDGTVWGASSGEAFLKLNREMNGAVETLDGGFGAALDGLSAYGSDLYAIGIPTRAFTWPSPPPDHIWRFGKDATGDPPAWSPVSPPCPTPPDEGEPKCMRLRAVWVESSSRQWFAGDDGNIFRGEGTDVSDAGDRLHLVEMDSRSLRRLNALWGVDGNDVWAVGAQGVIRHFRGEAWEIVPSPVARDLYGVWGSRADDVWAVGDDGVVIHWDGVSWTVKAIPFTGARRPRLYAVAGAGEDVWVAGEGALFRSASARGGGR